MVYFACTNKLNCSAERERGRWWQASVSAPLCMMELHKKYIELVQPNWKWPAAPKSKISRILTAPLTEVLATQWAKDRESLSLSVSAYLSPDTARMTKGMLRTLGAFLKSHTWSEQNMMLWRFPNQCSAHIWMRYEIIRVVFCIVLGKWDMPWEIISNLGDNDIKKHTFRPQNNL